MWEGGPELQEVETNVYITNFFGAKNKSKLTAQGITHVLVCAHELPEVFPNVFTIFYNNLDKFIILFYRTSHIKNLNFTIIQIFLSVIISMKV